jgi:lactate racemase
VRESLVHGPGWIEADLPDDTRVVSPGITLPLPPSPDLADAVRDALQRPLDTAPLRDLARGKRRALVAFDDPTVPCYAPLWSTAIPLVLGELERAGVPETGVTLVCANALHRKFTHDELASVLGEATVARFAPDGRLVCHDAEDPDNIARLGETDAGAPVHLNRLVVDSDLVVYVNASTTRGFSGGWKSVCVGLSTYASIASHHSPDTMSMTTEKNRMHEVLDQMGSVVERELGADRIFKVETILSNPLQVHRVLGGTVGATREEVLRITRAYQPPRRTLADEPADVVVYGVPDWSPYAAFSFPNPILSLVSTGLGYLGGMIQAIGKPGCTAVIAHPCPNVWDDRHHPSYREVWERVLPETRDPYEARERFEPDLARREEYVAKYRHGFGFHGSHAVMALYPLKRLRHASRVIVVAPGDPAVPAHLGFDSAPTVERALEMSAEWHGRDQRVALVRYPPAANRV